MKYRVIGWTYYDNSEILSSGNTIGFAERNAIIDEIRKHKYLFSGWHHQESWNGVVPILNDGRKRCFSQRGWGGVMSEAYNHMESYDYALYSFNQSIDSSKLKFAPEYYDIEDFEPEVIENEDFKVEVSEALFNIAKTSNPFYLEDLDELRYIDSDDTITLSCNGEELYFVVKDIDRNIASKDLKNSNELIKGRFKIIVTHKPENERRKAKAPIILTRSRAFDMFEGAMNEYNYDVIEAVIETFDIDYIIGETDKKKVKAGLTRFIREYTNNIYKSSNAIQILKYINNYKLFEEIASKVLENDKSIYITFINYYLEKGKNMDEHILRYAGYFDPNEDKYSGAIDIILEAISLKPENKSLRRKYYKAIKDTFYEGLSIMAGAGLFKNLRKRDKCLTMIDKYPSYSEDTIREIVEYLTYPVKSVKEKTYPYYIPKIYRVNVKSVADGVKAYQEYVKANYDLDAIMEHMILNGIDKICYEMDRYLDGERHAANYVYAMDLLTNYKYNFKEKALDKYSSKFEDFKEAVFTVYNKYKNK